MSIQLIEHVSVRDSHAASNGIERPIESTLSVHVLPREIEIHNMGWGTCEDSEYLTKRDSGMKGNGSWWEQMGVILLETPVFALLQYADHVDVVAGHVCPLRSAERAEAHLPA